MFYYLDWLLESVKFNNLETESETSFCNIDHMWYPDTGRCHRGNSSGRDHRRDGQVFGYCETDQSVQVVPENVQIEAIFKAYLTWIFSLLYKHIKLKKGDLSISFYVLKYVANFALF